jgi:hypothetical protein
LRIGDAVPRQPPRGLEPVQELAQPVHEQQVERFRCEGKLRRVVCGEQGRIGDGLGERTRRVKEQRAGIRRVDIDPDVAGMVEEREHGRPEIG